MNNIVSVLCLINVFFLQAQSLIKPTLDSEILEKYVLKPHFKLSAGEASKILILDTIYFDDGKDVEMTIYGFNEKNKFSLKRYVNKNLVGYRTFEIDSIGRILSYTDSLSSGSISTQGNFKKHITRANYFYKEDRKIIERVDGDGNPVYRNIVYYDSLKNPTMISGTYILHKNIGDRLQTIDYNYDKATYVYSDYKYKSDEPHINNGFINLDYIIDKNEQGDITKMYWPLSQKSDGIIHEIDYTYDEKGNWIKMFKTLTKPGEQKTIISKTYRKIKYKG